MTASPLLGRLLWYELLTTDMKGAEDFYQAVVGWSVTPFEGSPMPYHMWMRGGQVPVGGVMTLPDEVKAQGVPPNWMMYAGVPKLEDAAAHIERLGGRALSPIIEVPTVGRMRAMADPQGGAFSIYQPASPPQQPEAEPELGDVSWHELYTTDAAAALTFYGEALGWKPTEAMDMGPAGVYHMFGRHLG
ncbi:MAG: VOC family protein, partial [Acidobacteriota bacterium]